MEQQVKSLEALRQEQSKLKNHSNLYLSKLKSAEISLTCKHIIFIIDNLMTATSNVLWQDKNISQSKARVERLQAYNLSIIPAVTAVKNIFTLPFDIVEVIEAVKLDVKLALKICKKNNVIADVCNRFDVEKFNQDLENQRYKTWVDVIDFLLNYQDVIDILLQAHVALDLSYTHTLDSDEIWLEIKTDIDLDTDNPNEIQIESIEELQLINSINVVEKYLGNLCYLLKNSQIEIFRQRRIAELETIIHQREIGNIRKLRLLGIGIVSAILLTGGSIWLLTKDNGITTPTQTFPADHE